MSDSESGCGEEREPRLSAPDSKGHAAVNQSTDLFDFKTAGMM
ncbi:hypothetical protein WSK_1108 [Novosphingobium sp. Rr 2-17]|nr:hypothetical protein WSK_1108 [Novosphingobium sp. Rr 2-17]